MKVKSVLKECLAKMGEEDLFDKPELTEDEQKLKARLLKALNVIYREIISCYLPLTFAEDVELFEGRLKTSTLSRDLLFPIRLEREGKATAFRALGGEIVANFSGAARLTYAYMPEGELAEEDDAECMRLSVSAFADGVLGEYYFENRSFELAKSYDADFRNKLGLVRIKGRMLRMPARGWDE